MFKLFWNMFTEKCGMEKVIEKIEKSVSENKEGTIMDKYKRLGKICAPRLNGKVVSR